MVSQPDLRRFARVNPQSLIEVKSERDLQEFVSSSVRDISLGGIFIETDQVKPIGTTIYFRFPYNNDYNVCELVGKVVRSIPPTQSSDIPFVPGIGVKFDEMGKTAKEVLSKVIKEFETLNESHSEVIADLDK